MDIRDFIKKVVKSPGTAFFDEADLHDAFQGLRDMGVLADSWMDSIWHEFNAHTASPIESPGLETVAEQPFAAHGDAR